MPDHAHPISSPCEPNGSGELKNWTKNQINCQVLTFTEQLSKQTHVTKYQINLGTGARWRSGRASDSESRGHGFDPHKRHRVVSLSKLQYWLNPGSVGSG